MKRLKLWSVGMTVSLVCLLTSSRVSEAGTLTAGKSHIGTFEGSTTFTTSSSNGINPGLFIEVRDADGNLKQYTSEDGVITVENTKEGAYVTQAKLLGKTKYRDQVTGDLLDSWEDGRNLTLESVQMPVLKTTGKNLLEYIEWEIDKRLITNGDVGEYIGNNVSNYINVSNLDVITFSGFLKGSHCLYDKDKNPIGGRALSSKMTVDVSGADYIRVTIDNTKDYSNPQMEVGSVATSYEPYKSNILSCNEEVELGSVGEVKDELNLLTGQLTQRTETRAYQEGDEANSEVITDMANTRYKLPKESIKTVDLSSTYAFNLISDSVVQIKGEILPTIYSITVPSQPLTFAINPNGEPGQQFIAPEFEITNESPGPIQLELKAFEQVTKVLNDVLPDRYPDWTQLNKKQSKDIALALVPEASDGWLTLNQGPRYVANSANTILGEIRKDATVRFSFSARHGGVFEANLFPEYRLVFTFGF